MKKFRVLFIIITIIFTILTITSFILYLKSSKNNGEIILIDMELVRKRRYGS